MERCEVDPDTPCAWQLIVTRLEEEGRLRSGRGPPPCGLVAKRGERAQKNSPGGSENVKTESRLKKVLSAGHFAVTAECGPPKGADPELSGRREIFCQGLWTA